MADLAINGINAKKKNPFSSSKTSTSVRPSFIKAYHKPAGCCDAILGDAFLYLTKGDAAVTRDKCHEKKIYVRLSFCLTVFDSDNI